MDWVSHISQINWLAVLPAFIATMAIGRPVAVTLTAAGAIIGAMS